ncbi:glycoside hydrolase [Lophium mytilinum]|uniref:mannan endo-1,4-beta-mannosidase n=1 Tax=Lophium mytilinum TaxID=390894 RepID=A0A6A6QWX2_9PEZI|nr:glycoside hydrolase [Lophium mytilinum]
MKLPLLLTPLALSAFTTAIPSDPVPNFISPLLSSLSNPLKGSFAPWNSKLLSPYKKALSIALQRNTYVTRRGSELLLSNVRWTASGANVYWLGLDENVIPPAGSPFYAPLNASYPTKGRITEIMSTVAVLGGRTVRSQTLGVSVGNPLSLMPELGVVNEEAFETMDWAVYEARMHGVRLFAPLVDNYDYYHGGKFTFLRWRGVNISASDPIDPKVQEFYTNPTIVADFKNYIKILLTHVNPYTGLSYAADPTIFAYETGNELGGPKFQDMNVPVSWTAEIASYIKKLAPAKLVIDGTYGINKTHLSLKDVDIFSDHFYPPNNTKLTDGIDLVASADKVYFAAEYGWTDVQPDMAPLEDFFATIESYQEKKKPVIAGDHFWSLFMHNVPDCTTYVNHSSDSFTLQYGNPTNPVNVTEQVIKIRQHLFKMKGETVDASLPIAPCPGTEADLLYT